MTESTEIATTSTTDAELMNTLSDNGKVALIRDMFAKGCNDNEFAVFIELARRYRLDPFSRQIWAIKYGNNPAQIFVGRDGLLAIAHRTGVFDGLESGIRVNGNSISAWARVYRRDMSHPFEDEVFLEEYSTNQNLWKTKPKTMLQKVAEAHVLRKAFSISGLYSPEEVPDAEYVIHEPAPASASAPQSELAGQKPVAETAPADSAKGCVYCGKAPLTGETLAKYTESFKRHLDFDLPTPICEECANKLWRERSNPKPMNKPADKSAAEKPRCQCGKEAMEGYLLTKYVRKFREVLGMELPMPLCEDCAATLWAKLLSNRNNESEHTN